MKSKYGLPFLIDIILGACFEWRIAISAFAVIPICSFICVLMSPESPHWLKFKSKNEDALKSLILLRGKNNMDIINTEFESISRSSNFITDITPKVSVIKKYWKILTDRTFLEPLILLFVISQDKGGVFAITFYMVPFLQ